MKFSTNGLFRKEALQASHSKTWGPLLVTFPLSDYCLIGFAILFLACTLVFLLLTEFEEKMKVQGVLDMKPSLLKVFPYQAGVVSKVLVRTGQKVHKGQGLFIIRTQLNGMEKTTHQHLSELKNNHFQLEKEIHTKAKQLGALKKLLHLHYLSESEYNRQQLQLIQLKQQSTQIQTQIMNTELRQAYVVKASKAGEVYELNVEAGQFVNESTELLKLSPIHAQWRAYLNIPMQGVGFINSKPLQLHLDAYSNSTDSRIEGKMLLQPVLKVRQHLGFKESFYRVEVALTAFYLSQKGPILPGMTLNTTLNGRKKSLWKWLRQIDA